MKRTLKRESKALEIVKSETNGGSNGCGRMSGAGLTVALPSRGMIQCESLPTGLGQSVARLALSIMRRLLVGF